MNRMVDADKFLQNMADLYRQAGWDEREVHFSLVDLQMNIFMEDTIPIPVIRCKDCVFCKDNVCTLYVVERHEVDDDDFCSDAERKEE